MNAALISKINVQKTKPKEKPKDPPMNTTLQGVLVNTHLREPNKPVEFDEVCDSLLISTNGKQIQKYEPKEKENSFDVKKAIKPLLIGTAAAFLGVGILSLVIRKGSKALLNTQSFEQLPDLALNMNIKQEPQFATYRMLRDPSFKNIMGAGAVFLFSGLSAVAKNFVDGAKEIWVKKQEADVERDLQENLIEVETSVFSGKLKTVSDMLGSSIHYFKKNLNGEDKKEDLKFKGKNSENTDKGSIKKEGKNPYLFWGLTAGVVLGAVAIGKFSFSNIKKTLSYANDFTNKYTQGTLDAIAKIAHASDKNQIPALEALFESIAAKPDYIREIMAKIGASEEDITRVIKKVEESKKTLFADAPTALGGIPKKIQYYCYLDEDRGHLYNWVVNPENKFTKYIFLSFTAISAVGYIFKQAIDAVKAITVARENSKTELGLKKRLVEVEIENFKAKKNSAVEPMLDGFNQKIQEGKSKEELKKYAENILFEIKNGPPYVYA